MENRLKDIFGWFAITVVSLAFLISFCLGAKGEEEKPVPAIEQAINAFGAIAPYVHVELLACSTRTYCAGYIVFPTDFAEILDKKPDPKAFMEQTETILVRNVLQAMVKVATPGSHHFQVKFSGREYFTGAAGQSMYRDYGAVSYDSNTDKFNYERKTVW